MFWITQMHEICKQFGRVLYEEYVMSLQMNRIHFNQAVYVYAGSLPAILSSLPFCIGYL